MTDFEKKHWQQALLEIPHEAKLISVSPTNCRIEMIGIFYRLPNEKSNNYIRATTQHGKAQKKTLISAIEPGCPPMMPCV